MLDASCLDRSIINKNPKLAHLDQDAYFYGWNSKIIILSSPSQNQ